MTNTLQLCNSFIKKIENSKNLSSLTIKAYQSDLLDFMQFDNKKDIISYINHLRVTKILKDTSIKRKLVTINMYYEYLADLNLMDNNTISKLKFNFKIERRLPKALTVREVSKNLKRC